MSRMDDYISRKWLMECVDKVWVKFDTERDKNIYIHLVMDLAPSADVPQWIPRSERMPENSRTVLVTDWGITGFGRRFDGRWWDCDGNVLKDVSAWMPLPEPYKEGDTDGCLMRRKDA